MTESSATARPGRVPATMPGADRQRSDLVGRWSGSAFQREAAGWVDEVLAGRGLARSGPLQPEKIRFWSAVFRVPIGSVRVADRPAGTRSRDLAWLKVGNPGQAFEGRLLAASGRIAPDRVVVPWAVDEEQGRWLLPDGGPTLDGSRPRDWVGLLTDVADLQRMCAPHRAELDMVPGLPAVEAPGWCDGTVHRLAALPPHDPQHLARERAEELLGRLGRLADRMALLARAGPPETLQPNDAHPRNAVGPLTPGGPARVFDLGDAVWSHPWAVLHTTVRLAAGVRLTEPWPDTPLTRRVLDAYADRWPEVDRADRAEVAAAADRLGALHRAASWLRLLAPVDPDRLGVPTPSVADWLELALA